MYYTHYKHTTKGHQNDCLGTHSTHTITAHKVYIKQYFLQNETTIVKTLSQNICKSFGNPVLSSVYKTKPFLFNQYFGEIDFLYLSVKPIPESKQNLIIIIIPINF